jgi:hypothetical protein
LAALWWHAGVRAAPSTFEAVIGGAVLCRHHVDPAYLTDYLTRFFKAPYKTEGEAHWFRTEPGQRLYFLEITDIFVSTGDSDYVFVGVVVKDKLEAARKVLLEEKGIRFIPDGGPGVLRSPEGAFLIGYGAQSKLYCAKNRPDRPIGPVIPPGLVPGRASSERAY